MLHRGLGDASWAECQSTHMGGPMRLQIRIDRQGALHLERLVANEEIRNYATCVRRELARIAFAPRDGETTAEVTLRFRSTGIAATTSRAPGDAVLDMGRAVRLAIDRCGPSSCVQGW